MKYKLGIGEVALARGKAHIKTKTHDYDSKEERNATQTETLVSQLSIYIIFLIMMITTSAG